MGYHDTCLPAITHVTSIILVVYPRPNTCIRFHSVLFIVLLFEKCTACQSQWKSGFGWHRFQKGAYSLALVRNVRGLKVSSDSGLTWWPSGAASRLVSLSYYCLWCVFIFGFQSRAYFIRLVYARDNDVIYNGIRFKKPLDIFWPQIQRKYSE